MSPGQKWLRAACCLLVCWLTGAAHAAPAWQQAQNLLRKGRYEQALHMADPMARQQGGKTTAGRAALLIAARAEVALGLLARARLRLELATAEAPNNLPLRAELADVADAMGDRATLHAIMQSATRLWQHKGTNRQDAANLVALARIAQRSENFKWANELYREAVAQAPAAAEPQVAWGFLFLKKHAAREAEACFQDALRADARNADALVGHARTQLEKGYERRAAERALAAALQENPRHARAIALQGEIALDGEDFPAVETFVTRLRDINPRDEGAAWLSAALAKLRDQAEAYEKERERRLSVRPGDGGFFVHVAEALVRQRRYRDARTVADECLDHAPEEARCRTILGTTLLRLGEEAAGLAALRAAFAKDPYDVRTFNQLTLFDKTIKNNYVVFETEHLRFRVQPQHKLALERIVAPHLERVFVAYQKKYAYTPPSKVTFELFGDASDFAVRAVGVPALEVSAVCFGTVITSVTPTAGTMNWGIVLSHELAHVFSLGLSEERVPRWLTEGLAEWETAQLHAEWRRRDDLALWKAHRRNGVRAFGRMSRAFFEAANNEEANYAYLLSVQAVEFLIERHGFVAVRKMLVELGAGRREDEALASATGASLADLNRDFAQHLEARLSAFAPQFLPSAEPEVSTPAGQMSVQEFARAALTSLAAEDADKADALLVRAEQSKGEKGKESPRARALLAYAKAAVAEHRGADAQHVVALLQPVLDQGFDGFDLRVKLGFAALRAGATEAAVNHLRVAVALAPEQVMAWALLAEAHDRAGDERAMVEAGARAFMLEPQSAKRGKALLQRAAAVRAQDVVAALGPWVVFADPDDPEVHELYGRALAASGRAREATAAFGHALAFAPRNAETLKVELERLHQRLGDRPSRGQRPQEPTQPPAMRGPAPPLPEPR